MDPGDDFPAAHSMDSGWFAVDRDGHVAYFYTGEAGALPTDACREEPTGMLHELEAVVPRTEPVYDLASRSGLHEEETHHATTAADGGRGEIEGRPWSILLFPALLDAVAEE